MFDFIGGAVLVMLVFGLIVMISQATPDPELQGRVYERYVDREASEVVE